MKMKRRTCGVLAAMGLLSLAAPALAEYPDRPIRIVVGYAPGGGVDLVARILGDQLAKDLGTSVVVENKPGGTTTLAASTVASAKPDGYTLMLTTGTTAVASGMMEGLPYDYSTDLTGVALIATNDFALIVPKDSEIKSLEDFVRVGREKDLTYSSSGINSPSHLMAEEIGDALGLKLINVPFSGSSQALTAVLGGEVDFNFSVTSNSAPILKEGQAKGIAVTAAEPNVAAPDLPPIASAGIENYEAVTWYALLAPTGVPDDILEKLNVAIGAAVQTPEVSGKLQDFGYTIKTASLSEFQEFAKTETERWLAVAKKASEQN